MSGHDWRQCYPDERNELIARMRDMLERLQWTDGTDGCMFCGRLRTVGHGEHCELARLLEETK